MLERFKRTNDTGEPTGGGTAVAEHEVEHDDVVEPAGEPTSMAPAAAPPSREDVPESERDPESEPVPESEYATEQQSQPQQRAMAPIVEQPALHEMRARQRARFGGVSWGAAFFGWLCAVGLAAILSALLVAAGVAIGWSEIKGPVNGTSHTIGLGGGILLVIVLAISWFCGGYVAGRMSRFDGARQGWAVFVWTVLAVIVIWAFAAIGGHKYDVFDQLNLPRVPANGHTFTTGGWIALGAAVVVTLVGAIAGGKTGERFHRRVDMIAASDWDAEPAIGRRGQAVRA
jgi:hypothetical protein